MSWWKRLISGNKKQEESTAVPVSCPQHLMGTENKLLPALREKNPDFELFMAQAELESGLNLAHGAQHLADLLQYDPTNTAWLALTEDFYNKAGSDPENTLLPPSDTLYATTEALRAWIWHRQGRLQEAISGLIQVTRATQNNQYLHTWGLSWLEPLGAVESLPSELNIQLIGTLCSYTPEMHLSTVRQLRPLQRWAKLAKRITPPEDFHHQWPMLHIGLLRRAGLFDEALELAKSIQTPNDWHLSVATGLVLRRQQNRQEAEHAFQHAIRFNPEELTTYLEIADMWFDNGDWAKAADRYKHVLQREAEHTWALPSHAFCKWRITGNNQFMEQLIAMAQAGNPRAQHLWFQTYGGLPEPEDATANILRQLRETLISTPATTEQLNNPNEIKLNLSALEAPSNELAFNLEFAALGRPLQLTINIERIPSPDPRQSIAAVTHPLWGYNGSQARPAISPPSSEIQQKIAELASVPFNLQESWASASHLALELGPASGNDRSLEVLATMVFPPALPNHTHALQWLPRVQLTAVQVIAQLDEGWLDSRRRELLLSVLFGPSDWATCAAIRALAWIGANEPIYALDIHQSFVKLENYRPDIGHCCWLSTLYRYWQDLPCLFDTERDTLKTKWDALTTPYVATDEAEETPTEETVVIKEEEKQPAAQDSLTENH